MLGYKPLELIDTSQLPSEEDLSQLVIKMIMIAFFVPSERLVGSYDINKCIFVPSERLVLF
jgi:hypothetical protein